MKRYAIAIAAGLLVVAEVAWFWEDAHGVRCLWRAGTSGDPSKACWDPDSACYVSWKAGTYPASLAPGVTGAMIADPRANEIVVGKTTAQLRAKFGLDLITTEYDSYRGAYLRICQTAGLPQERRYRPVLFLDSGAWPWMIVLQNDTATELVLLKGC